ncbi:MAG: hypothetical protein GX442_18390 [Candidatus Riflebacteria bacterium]|nr:hypothetical protein [Candidatus Riflebacteria bacterium]
MNVAACRRTWVTALALMGSAALALAAGPGQAILPPGSGSPGHDSASGPVRIDGKSPVTLPLEIVATTPTRLPRALARSAEGALWAAFQAEEGVMQGAGLARVLPPPVLPVRGPGRAGWRSDKVHALLPAADDAVLAATDHGLHRVEADGKTTPLGEDLPWHLLAAAPDGTVWMAGIDADHRLAVGRLDGSRVLIHRAPGRFREILRLFPQGPSSGASHHHPPPLSPVEEPEQGSSPGRSHSPQTVSLAATALVVTSDGIHEAGPTGLKALPLKKTPLFLPPSHSVERRMPPIWLYDAARTPDGSLFLIGAHKTLVRRSGGRFEVVGAGHFSELCAGLGDQELLAADFDGRLWHWDGRRLACVDRGTDRRHLRHLTLDDRGSLWAEEDAADGRPHAIVRYDPPYTDGPRARASLGLFPGLLSPGVLALLGDGQGGCLLSTNEGICRVPPDDSGPQPLPPLPDPLASPGGAAMSHHIIRNIPMAHCARGPEACPKCRALAAAGPRPCLLDIAPPDQGMVTRRVIECLVDGVKVWREFDIVRTFADEAEARTYAAEHGITDLELAPPGTP